MASGKAQPTSLSAAGRVHGAIGLVVMLASLAACSHPATSAAERGTGHAKVQLLASDPYAGQTPAQRRAAWLKREPVTQATASITQSTGTSRPVSAD